MRVLAGYFLIVPAGGALTLLESQAWRGLAQFGEKDGEIGRPHV